MSSLLHIAPNEKINHLTDVRSLGCKRIGQCSKVNGVKSENANNCRLERLGGGAFILGAALRVYSLVAAARAHIASLDRCTLISSECNYLGK
jgi:hypothetical protein